MAGPRVRTEAREKKQALVESHLFHLEQQAGARRLQRSSSPPRRAAQRRSTRGAMEALNSRRRSRRASGASRPSCEPRFSVFRAA